MKLTIDKKVGLFITSLIFALGSILGYYFIQTQTRLMSDDLDERAAVLLSNLSLNAEFPVLIRDHEAVSRLVKGVMAQKDIVYCRIEGKDGVLLYEKGQRGKGPVREFSAPVYSKTMEGGEALILDVPKERTEEVGKVYLAVTLSELNRKISEIKGTVTAVVIGAFILASLGVYLLIRRLIGAPVKELVRATERIAAGDLGHRVVLTTNDEFELLGDSFNRMTESLQAAQAEVVRREKLAVLGQLAAGVGNELRNPLGVMNNAVFFLKDVLIYADDTVKEYLNIIKNEIENSHRIISDFIDFFRTKTPRAKVIMAHELIAECLGKCAIPDHVEVRVDVPESLPPIKVDPLQMMQVFQNLITNAVQAMPIGGALRISARRHGDFVEISVADTGKGISPADLEKIFQPLFSTKSRGIGLGLPISRNLVEANGGRIEVESRLGEGTTFTVILPVERDKE